MYGTILQLRVIFDESNLGTSQNTEKKKLYDKVAKLSKTRCLLFQDFNMGLGSFT